jgi:hypothetical protein
MAGIKKPLSYLDLDRANPTSTLFEKLFRDAVDYKKEIDNVFDALVLTEPTLASREADAVVANKIRTTEEKDATRTTNYIFIARILGRDSPHNLLPDPIDFNITDDEECKKRYHNLLQLHTKVSANGLSDSELPSQGDTVKIRLSNGVYSFDTSFSRDFLGIASRATTSPQRTSKLEENNGNAKDAFKKNKPIPLSSTGPGTAIINLSNSLPEITAADGIISGTSLDGLTSVVENELSLWSGKKEREEQMYSTLKKYWDNLGVTKWTPSSVPWSAAFISWVVGQADSGFPKSAGHYFYAEAAQKGTGAWSAWKVGSAKIQAQVGDIFVRPRKGKGASRTSSHGDVVFKIEGGKAFLAGGNLGDSARIEAELPIDSEGNYTSYKKYIVVLKKNGSVKSTSVA